MDFKQIQSIIRNFEKSTMTNLEIETDEFKLKLSKLNEKVMTKYDELPKGEGSTPVDDVKSLGVEVKSPLVGTYYASDKPDGNPFVSVGSEVKAGQTLCIIEAMKIMNEITAPISGTIESISVVNGAAVGFDQVLMVIK